MPDIYDQILDQEQQAEQQRLKISLDNAVKIPPEQAAKANQLSRSTGLPTDTVSRNLSDVANVERARQLQQLASDDPVLARQLSIPEFAASAHDQAEPLSGVSRAVRNLAVGFAGDFVGSSTAGMGHTLHALERLTGSKSILADTLTDVGETTKKYWNDIAPKDEQTFTDQVFRGLGQIAGQLPVMAVAAPVGVGMMIGQGSDQMAEKIKRDKAAQQADQRAQDIEVLSGGAITGVTEWLSSKLLLKPPQILALKNVLLNRVANVAVGATGEGIQEMSENIGQDLAHIALTSPESKVAFGEAIEAGGVGAIVGAVTSSLIQGALHIKARGSQQAFSDLSDASKAQKYRDRDPGGYQGFADAAAAHLASTADGAVENIYVDANTFNQVMAAAQLDPVEVAAIIPSIGQQLDEAAVTGGDLVIPLNEFVGKIAGTEVGDMLTPHLRSGPDALSISELEMASKIGGDIQAKADEIMATHEQKAEFVKSANEVQKTVLDQIIATGVYAPGAARSMAPVVRDFYVTQAAEMGITPMELYQMMPYQVVSGDLNNGGQVMQDVIQLDQSSMGVNINDDVQPFTDQILSGEKTIETRSTPSLRPYVGKRIGIVKTGKGKPAMLVGYATVGEEVKYDSPEAFDAAVESHRVAPDSPFYNGGVKYGYTMQDVERIEPRPVTSRGIVSRSLEQNDLADKIAQALTENGPSIDSPVALPPSPTLYQVHPESINEWKTKTTEWMKANGYTDAEIKKHLKAMDGQMKIFTALGAQVEMFPKGAKAAPSKVNSKGIGGPFRGNSDFIYKITFDASAMCVRRLEAGATAAAIEEKINRSLTASERMALVVLFQQAGKVAPCLYCYVESPRTKMSEFAQNAADIVKGDKVIPKRWSQSMQDKAQAAVDEAAGLTFGEDELNVNLIIDPLYQKDNLEAAQALAAKAPATWEFINSAALAAKANLPKLYEEYSGQVLELPQEIIDELNDYAGLRFFSSSDFQAEHVGDLMQAFVDMEMRRIKAHAYTKVVSFAEIFGKTGMKIQLSIFAKVNPDGSYSADTSQGMDWDDAKRLRSEKGHENVGTVFVAASDEQLQWALSQDWIDYIIPFHYSGMASKFYEALGWQDFTSTQSESWIDKDDERNWDVAANQEERGQKTAKGGDVKPKAKKIRMHEIGTVKGISDEQATKQYLKLAMERRLNPVFLSALFTDFAPLVRTGDMKKDKAARAKQNREAKARWKEMVDKGQIDWSAINPNYFKLKKDYARTDTPFNPVQAKFNYEATQKIVDSFLNNQEPKAVSDPAIAEKFIELQAKYGQSMGLEALKAKADNKTFFQSAYSNAPDSLMGFRKNGENKGFDETKYKTTEYVKLTWPGDSEVYFDAVKGLNSPHAMERARRNWPGATVEKATKEDFDNFEPERLFQKQGGNKRGGFNPDSLTTILTQQSDYSTFLHETAHFFLTSYASLAASPNATPKMQQDMQTLLDWFGVDSLATWNAMTLEEQRPFHEQFAYNYEIYLFEGKAPNIKMQGLFERFSAWLKKVYTSIRDELNTIYRQEHGTDLPILTGEVKDVMDRMLASDQQIKQAEAVRGMAPMFQTQEQSGMTDEEWAAYQAMQQEAHDAALAEHTTKSMRQMKWLSNAKSRVLKKLQGEAREAREKIKAEVTAEVEAYENYRSYKIYDEVKKGGDPAEMAAVLDAFGYTSEEHLEKSRRAAPNKKSLINSMVDQRMLEEHGELTDPKALANAVDAAIHNEARARFIAVELRHLAKSTRPVRVMQEAARQAARAILGKKAIKTIRPKDFAASQAKAAAASEQAMKKGDTATATQAKEHQLLQNQLASEALKANAFVAKSLEEFKKVFVSDKRLAKSRDMNYVNVARAILAHYGLGSTEETADGYLKKIKQYDPEFFAEIEDLITAHQQQSKPITDLTLDEFTDLADQIAGLWHLSRRTKQIEIDGQLIDRKAVVEELNARARALTTSGERPGYAKAMTKWDKTKIRLMGMRAAMRRVEAWVSAMDGGNPNGPFRKYVWNPISEAVTAYRLAKVDYMTRYLEMLKDVEPILKGQNLTFKDANGVAMYEFTPQEFMHALLHTGNGSNKRKLLLGRGWAMEDEEGNLDSSAWDAFVLANTTKEHYDFAQKVWDLMEQMKPAAQKAHKSMYGFYFNEITAEPIATPWGVYPGGYVPAVTDPDIVTDAAMNAEKETQLTDNSFMFPTTGRGFTKGRVEYNKPLLLNLGYLNSHMDKVLRFSHIEPRVKDVARIIKTNRSFAEAMDALDPTARGDMLVPWLQRTAMQMSAVPSKGAGGKGLDAAASWLRANTGMQMMVGNISNTLQQFTGLSISALKVGLRPLRNGIWLTMKSPKETAAMVEDKSDYMKTRMTNSQFEIQATVDELLLNPSKYEQLQAFASKHGYFMQQATQNFVDTATWVGGYNEAIEAGLDEKEAVRRADAAVRMTQGSFAPEDASRIEGGSPFVRLFSQFYSYFNMQANILGTEFVNVARNLGVKNGAGKMLYIYTFGYMIPAVLTELITQALSGFDLGDDDEFDLWDAMRLFFNAQAKPLGAFIPGAGPAIMAGFKAWNNNPMDDRINASPAISAIEGTVRLPYTVYKAIVDEGSWKKASRDFLTGLGMVTRLPLGQLGKPIGYGLDVAQGKATPESGMDVARGLISGRDVNRKQ